MRTRPGRRGQLPVALAGGAAAVLLAGATPAAAEPVRYRLDPAHSFVHFEVMHFATSTLRGRLGPVEGEVSLDPAAGHGAIGLRIDTRSVSTGVPVLDRRLCQPDLLDCAEPAFFVADRFEFEGGQVRAVVGELTLRGVSRGLRLQALRFGCRRDGETEVCGGDFEGRLRRSDFGASFGLPFVADAVRLVVQVEGRRR